MNAPPKCPLPCPLLAVFFDMDGTLYNDEIVNARYAQAAVELLAETRSLAMDDASAIFRRRREELTQRNGYKPSLTRTLYDLGIDWEIWNRAAFKTIAVEDRLFPDTELAARLAALRSRFKLSVVTNNSGPMTDKTLRLLGLADGFDDVTSITVSRTMKPDEAIYRVALSRLGLSVAEHAAHCLAVGDRYEIDLLPGENLGMVSRLCQTRESLFKLLDELDAHPGDPHAPCSHTVS